MRATLLATAIVGSYAFQLPSTGGGRVVPLFRSTKSKSGSLFLSEKTDTITATSDDPKAATKTDDNFVAKLFDDNADSIDAFCRGTNEFWKGLVIKPVRDYVEINKEPRFYGPQDTLDKLIAPPEVPGIPRPVWFTILGSVPTALGWYGYYKFSVEEELYQYEIQSGNKVTGCGGYGTLFPFVYGIIVGFPLSFLHLPGGEFILEAAGAWILLGQVNLYRRVNELCLESAKEELSSEPPLYSWWALLPPPLDVVVGLRQVHFLSEYWRLQRGEPYDKDVVAEDLFPFISSERFTLKKFFRTPSMWFWFTTEWEDFDFEILQEDTK